MSCRERSEEESEFNKVVEFIRNIDKMIWYRAGEVHRKDAFAREIMEEIRYAKNVLDVIEEMMRKKLEDYDGGEDEPLRS
jgi:hypothetical protein